MKLGSKVLESYGIQSLEWEILESGGIHIVARSATRVLGKLL
jgi:hypothetical protein